MLVDRQAGVQSIIEFGLLAFKEFDLFQDLLMQNDVFHVVALLNHLLLRLLLDDLRVGRVLQAKGAEV